MAHVNAQVGVGLCRTLHSKGKKAIVAAGIISTFTSIFPNLLLCHHTSCYAVILLLFRAPDFEFVIHQNQSPFSCWGVQ